MSDSVLKRYSGPRSPLGAREDPFEIGDDAIDDIGCYGWLRGLRERSPMLEFRRKDGCSVAYDYALLRKVCFDDESTPGIQLLRGIQNRRVPWVRELGEAEILVAAENGTVVERFEFAEAK